MKLLLDQGLPRTAAEALGRVGLDAVRAGAIGLSQHNQRFTFKHLDVAVSVCDTLRIPHPMGATAAGQVLSTNDEGCMKAQVVLRAEATESARAASAVGSDPPAGIFRTALVGRLRALLVVLAFVCLDCGSHAAMRSAPNFSGTELKNRKVLVLPIAVTDDYGDERTGIILDRETREEATRMACRSASDGQGDLALTCFDNPAVSSAAPVSDAVQAQFTRDRAVPKDQWLALAQQTGNDLAVLFRPEGE